MVAAWVEVPVSTKTGFTVTLLDVEDYERLQGRALSLGSHGYAQLWDERQMKVVHRWVLGLGPGRRLVGDHINFDKLDNRRSNLRVLTASLSNMNRRIKPARHEFGVYPARSGRWVACGYWNHRKVHIGTYLTPEAAAEAVRDWALKTRPEGEAIRAEVTS